MSRRLVAVASAALLSAFAPACGGKAPTSPTDAAPADAPLPPAAPIVQGYDDLRAALADDDLPRAQAAAKAYLATVKAENAAEPEKAALARLTEGLEATAAAADLDAARLAFGTASEGFLQLVVARPALKDGLHAFRCPMAAGYKQWAQREETMKNPYMGKKMLECGASVELAP